MSSWPVTFYPRPLIWTATYLSNFFFSEITGLFDGLFIRLFRSLDQNVYGKNKICSIKSCSWPWPILTLLRRSGERLRTFRSSCLFYLQKDNFVQCYSVLSDLYPMANNDYVTWLCEFSVILFYLQKITSLGEIGKICNYLPYINLNFLNWSGLSM